MGDCEGSWSPCTSACEAAADRQWVQTQAPSGTGTACPDAADACAPGEDECPVNVDCEGSWSPCTSACEAAADRQWVQTQAPSGTGTACPDAAEACAPGEDACSVGFMYAADAQDCKFLSFMEDLSDGHLDASVSGQR